MFPSHSTQSSSRTNTGAKYVGQYCSYFRRRTVLTCAIRSAGFPDGRVSPGPYYGRVNVHYLGGSNARGYQRTRSSRRDYYDGRVYDGYAPSYVSYSSYDDYADGRPSYR